MRRLLTMIARALMLRCPLCGQGALFSRWFALRDSCPKCGFWFEREQGYFTGAMAINLVAAELVLLAGGLAWILTTWPNVPWTQVYAWGVAAVLVPLVFFPFSKTLWLAVDLFIRPAEEQEFAEVVDQRETGGIP